MATSTFRKAMGAVKDQTSISLAKVVWNVAPDLEVLVVKATSHENEPADDKYIREILTLMSYSRGYVSACVYAISKRLSKTRDWVVALKSLMLVHRLLNEGGPAFGEEMMYASRRGMRVLNMSGFRDEAHSNSWDHSGFVRAYALYLDQKFELLVHETKMNGADDNRSYSDSDEPEVKTEKHTSTQIKEMNLKSVLERLNRLLQILDRFLGCRPTGAAKNSRMVLVALYSLVKDSFKLYADICEALGVLSNQFQKLEYSECVKAFDAYVYAAKLIDELAGFYVWCDNVGITRSSEIPGVERITDSLLGTLEGVLREKANKPKSFEMINNEEVIPNMNEIKALPPPQNYASTPHPPPRPRVEQLPKPEATKVVVTEDLVSLKDDGVTADDQGNRMALALYGPLVTRTNGAWEEFSTEEDAGVTSAWQTPAAEIGRAGWELALAESLSNLSKQKADLAGGFNPLLLNGMYDQGTVRQHTTNTQMSSGSASSVTLPSNPTPLLALPGPDGSVEPVGPQDPFTASLLVPPPSYVQMADLERKQSLLVQEQQLWQLYANNGMRGQMGLAKITGGVGYYNASAMHHQSMPYGMPQFTGLEQPAYFFTPL